MAPLDLAAQRVERVRHSCGGKGLCDLLPRGRGGRRQSTPLSPTGMTVPLPPATSMRASRMQAQSNRRLVLCTATNSLSAAQQWLAVVRQRQSTVYGESSDIDSASARENERISTDNTVHC